MTWNSISSWGVNSSEAANVLAARYHPVARPHGHTIYLHNGVHRAAPRLTTHASSAPTRITSVIKEHLP